MESKKSIELEKMEVNIRRKTMGPVRYDPKYADTKPFTEAELEQYELTKLKDETFKEWRKRNKQEKDKALGAR